MDPVSRKPLKIHLVSSPDSSEFTHVTRALSRSSIVGLDAEWKPVRGHLSSFPAVTLLQLACRLRERSGETESGDSVVFLLDLLTLPLSSIWNLLRELFVTPDVLKLGFRFKQDLVYLSSTFCAQGCDPGFDRVEPYLDISSIYNYLKQKQPGRKTKESKSLSTISSEVLGFSLSKELQCSDWSHRPLTEEQKAYAATDALCLLEIFSVFQTKIVKKAKHFDNINELHASDANTGLKEILGKPEVCDRVLRSTLFEASDILQATIASKCLQRILITEGVASRVSCQTTMPMDEALLMIVRKYGEKVVLRESDKKPRASRRKGKKRSSAAVTCRERRSENSDDWQGPTPWDLSLGGDGCPKFLCDVMVEGLAKHLRCVGIDAATPSSRKPEARELIDQAYREKRILLTRDAKILRHSYLIQNQIYKVKSLLKNDQLLEVIETFNLKISEDQLMSRCTKCNGRFIQRPLTTEEAVEAAKGFQRIPDCLFNKNLEFWQCMDCRQLYWEGTQYHNAVQKFIDVCKLSA